MFYTRLIATDLLSFSCHPRLLNSLTNSTPDVTSIKLDCSLSVWILSVMEIFEEGSSGSNIGFFNALPWDVFTTGINMGFINSLKRVVLQRFYNDSVSLSSIICWIFPTLEER
uniref:Uncharacterized protein n=1 Tax=Lepeophtheirus salmonis TaxID=72036 RepID=A0A0K2TSI9_LEPSM